MENKGQQDRIEDISPRTLSVESVTRLIARDAAHATRVRALLAAGALKTGADFEKAAFIFQHGNQGAAWIATATLDRYLQRTGRPQVFGTQYGSVDGAPLTQEPFDRNMVPDSLRKELRVPSLEQQAKDLVEINKSGQPSPK